MPPAEFFWTPSRFEPQKNGRPPVRLKKAMPEPLLRSSRHSRKVGSIPEGRTASVYKMLAARAPQARGVIMEQASLLTILASSPGFAANLAGVMPAIRAGMNRAAARYEPGRKELVDAINETARREGVALTSGGGKQISKEVLDKWLQPGERGHAPGLEAIMCFCLAVKDYSPLEAIWKPFGLVLMPADDLRYLKLGKAQARYEEARAELKNARAKL